MAYVRVEIHATGEIAEQAERLFAESPFATNIARFRGASIRPSGDILQCDTPREAASCLLDDLKAIGIGKDDTTLIVGGSTASHLDDRATRLERKARGSASDALLWNVVQDTLDEEIELSFTFLAFMVLATLLGAVGVVTNSAILVVGAMVIGPEFGPIANFCVNAMSGHWRAAVLAWRNVTAGFLIAVIAAALFTAILRATGVFPDELIRDGLIKEVASPNWLTLIIALIAGSAGTLALTSARSATLVGVLISVTTIPAAADAAALIVYGAAGEAMKALLTLAINLTGIAAAGIFTLTLQRFLIPRLHRNRATKADA